MQRRWYVGLLLIVALLLASCAPAPAPPPIPSPTSRPTTATLPPATATQEAAPQTGGGDPTEGEALNETIKGAKPVAAKTWELAYDEGDVSLTITFPCEDFWTLLGLLKELLSASVNTARAVFEADAKLETLTLVYRGPVLGADRTETEEDLLMVQVSRATAMDAGWPDTSRCSVADVADRFELHDSMAESYASLCK